MSNKITANLNKVLRRLRAVNLWHLAWITILAEIVTAIMNTIMNTIMGVIWWGRVSYELILIGTVDAFVALPMRLSRKSDLHQPCRSGVAPVQEDRPEPATAAGAVMLPPVLQ